ncbi:RluA family pseudouridine synthase [uncultured Peptoniphilus sp.]|uniref:RluA family pseudouridine synthase n=2 Tax=Peptoniphilus TaxID=162289 RepID=UPI002806468D|nr:RluA family pseudouridine synthase [uncultured Peptoniphilus sp.]
MKEEFLIARKDENKRLDKFLEDNIDLSRSQIKKLIDSEVIILNEKKVKAGYSLKAGDKIKISYPEEPKPFKEEIDFKVIYEDEYLAIISKPQDLVVHMGAGNFDHTLVNGLLNRFENLSDVDPIRPGIVHRIDKDTSGLMIIAKTNESYYKLVEAFKNSEIKKYYLAICHGKNIDKGEIDQPIGRNPKDRKKMAVIYENSKKAVTRYKKILDFGDYALLKIRLLTGRTHQIRVHLAYIGHPVVGDLIYGRKNSLKITRQMLHAYKLIFNHPITGEKIEITDDFPERFKNLINKFQNYY